jgi:hypothetical protein
MAEWLKGRPFFARQACRRGQECAWLEDLRLALPAAVRPGLARGVKFCLRRDVYLVTGPKNVLTPKRVAPWLALFCTGPDKTRATFLLERNGTDNNERFGCEG